MKSPEEGFLLRIFIGESDRHHSKALYEAIVMKARELHLAGATVLKGVMGYGSAGGGHMHTAKLLELSEDLPIIIELVDTEENINKLMPFLDEVVTEGLITVEKVKVIKYRLG